MKIYAVQKDVPITVYVEAEDEEAAKEVANFRPAWNRLYGKETPALDAALAGVAIVGFPYDDIDVEERDLQDVPEGMFIFSEETPTCDICGEPDTISNDLMPWDTDWNGETGNHLSCEETALKRRGSGEQDDITGVITT